MRDRYNLNLLPGMSEDGVEYGEPQEDQHCAITFTSVPVNSFACVMLSDDVDLNSVAAIPGMGIPEQLKAAMEQEQSSKSQPGTTWTVSHTILRGFPNTLSLTFLVFNFLKI